MTDDRINELANEAMESIEADDPEDYAHARVAIECAISQALRERDAERDKHDHNWMSRHDDAQAKHAERIERLREVLTTDEWCQACKRKPSSATGHASDCVVAAALAQIT